MVCIVARPRAKLHCAIGIILKWTAEFELYLRRLQENQNKESELHVKMLDGGTDNAASKWPFVCQTGQSCLRILPFPECYSTGMLCTAFNAARVLPRPHARKRTDVRFLLDLFNTVVRIQLVVGSNGAPSRFFFHRRSNIFKTSVEQVGRTRGAYIRSTAAASEVSTHGTEIMGASMIII